MKHILALLIFMCSTQSLALDDKSPHKNNQAPLVQPCRAIERFATAAPCGSGKVVVQLDSNSSDEIIAQYINEDLQFSRQKKLLSYGVTRAFIQPRNPVIMKNKERQKTTSRARVDGSPVDFRAVQLEIEKRPLSDAPTLAVIRSKLHKLFATKDIFVEFDSRHSGTESWTLSRPMTTDELEQITPEIMRIDGTIEYLGLNRPVMPVGL